MTESAPTDRARCSVEIEALGAAKLIAGGWERRVVSDAARVAEMHELYVELGFETTTATLDPESFPAACTGCAETACTTYVALYTRKPVTDTDRR